MDLSSVHVGIHKLKKKKRVGRGPGSGHGKTASRGSKGQWASAGAKKPTGLFEGGQMQLFRRMPKRGFSHATWDKHFLPVNVGDLDKAFANGDKVTHETLKAVGLAKGAADGVRILGDGNLTKKLEVEAHHFSKSAVEKITAQGGKVVVIPPPKRPKRNKMGSRKRTDKPNAPASAS
ncbi:MAG: 50S ribosomal protein L15 [Gemmataceae bacterium]